MDNLTNKYFKLPEINPDYINCKDYFFLFETSLPDNENYLSYIFTKPREVIKVNNYKDVKQAFEKIEQCARNFYVTGYFSYELGYYFERDYFKAKEYYNFPLIYVCVFDKVIVFNHKTGKFSRNFAGVSTKHGREKSFSVSNLKLNISSKEYKRNINSIKRYIERGETYQVNYTVKYRFNFKGYELALYEDLKQRQNVSYGAFCKFKDRYVISLSPELFFRINGLKIYSRPMKGTIRRGKNIEEDAERFNELKLSIKDSAENLMIVDLIRNDIGRISKTGSVKTYKMFNIEKYNTLFQMTSTVSGILNKGTTYFDIFKNIFPGGSVTGAPKLRTMEIIKELEKDYRNVYCGALGLISPDKKAVFNLPIRTISLYKGKGEMGVGSGIVYDSDPVSEFKECVLKAKFLLNSYKPFKLLETILWHRKYRFLNEHLLRLKKSSRYFDSRFCKEEVMLKLKIVERNFRKDRQYKVRLLISKEGSITVEYYPLRQKKDTNNLVVLSEYKTNPDNYFYYHKTTNRNLYDSEYNKYHKKGNFDVIFLNNRKEVTEGAISNIIIKKGVNYYTPPVSSGLLAGIYRHYFIKKHKAKERIIRLKDLKEADKIYLCNSVRGLTEVKLKEL